ncbi:MAG: 4-(cytidine 5'-diphospho)-2-C-methyl-D-erythritol kinase [Xanthobacteraceae bacterium]|nr:4-(cytidine 5'-diphospho)-2-C-methyl-D-erythritol kinase [Xanthobacteraceae bacterium]
MSQLIERACAKVNLTLRVVGRRPDGYHDLDSIVAFADCADNLSFEPGPDLGLTMTGPGAVACGDTGDNLVIRAAELLKKRLPGLKLGHFTLDKHLPVAAGIGGGSADAAAALRLLANANAIVLDDPRLVDVARATGADVPVCLASHTCVMGGVGDNLTPLNLPDFPAVLVNPRVGVATKDVFAALGLRAGELRIGISDALEAIAIPENEISLDAWLDLLIGGTNDLEAPALKVQPIIADVLGALRDQHGVKLARMSGSGATCFAIFGTASEAQRAAAAIGKIYPNWWVHAGTLG